MSSIPERARLILAGGGDAPDSRPLDELFAGWLGTGGRLLYLPIASSPKADGYTGHRAWITSVFAPLGATRIETWADLGAHDLAALQDFDGVYIGGGNTFRLLHLLRGARLDSALRAYALDGGLVYGGSAGAILLGRDIASCAHDDPNTVGLRDTRALDLMGGHDVWCHYRAQQRAEVQAYSDRTGRPVYALPERGGLRVERGVVQFTGFEPGELFNPEGGR